MKKLIYVLLMSVWTINCLNTNHSDNSSTTGDKQNESNDSNMDIFRKQLLSYVVGAMIILFTFTCFCLLYYNCKIDVDPPRKKKPNNENMEAVSSWVSKVSAYQHEIANECALENQPLLLDTEQLSEPSKPDSSPSPLHPEKSIKDPVVENSIIPFSAEKLMQSSILEMSSMPCSSKDLVRQPSPKMSSNSSSRTKSHSSSCFKKSYRKLGIKNPQKRTYAHKLISSVRSFCPEKSVLTWLATLPSSTKQATSTCPSITQNEISSFIPSSEKIPDKSQVYHHVKKLMSMGKRVELSSPQPAKTCHYKERYLACSSSELSVSNTSSGKKRTTGSLNVSSKTKSFSGSFYEVDSKDNFYMDNVNNDDMQTGNSGDSDEEVIIFCDMNTMDVITLGILDN